MTPAELIAKISGLGGRLYLDDGELRLQAPKGSLPDALRAELKEKRQSLIDFLLAAQASVSKQASSITPVDRDQPLPAAFSQQRLWFHDELDPGSSTYNMPLSMHLKGELNTGALQAAIDDLVNRHESLRTRFESDGEVPLQVIDNDLSVKIEPDTRNGASDEWIAHWLAEKSSLPFDLRNGPLLRMHLLQTGASDHRLLIVVHHIISDAWSMSVLVHQLSELYSAHSTGRSPQLHEQDIQYADYAAWQREWLLGPELQRQTKYWSDRLAGAPPLLELPIDKPRPVAQSYAGDRLKADIPAALTHQLRAVAQANRVSMFMLLQAAFSVLLARYSGADDIVIGTPIAGRQHAELESLIGLFLNILVLRNDLSGNPAFADVLKNVRKNTLEAYEHQDLPFEKLIDELRPERQLSYSPVFQVIFNLHAQSTGTLGLGDLNAESEDVTRPTAKFDLALMIGEFAEHLSLEFEFATDLFHRRTIERMVIHYRTLLQGIVANPSSLIHDLPMLAPDEKQKLLVDWNQTRADYPAGLTIQALFEAQAAQNPDGLALVCGDAQLSYAELNLRANHLAHHLIAHGVVAEVPVAICMDRGLDTVLAILAILKAGGAYVPLDPAYPSERLQFMLSDCAARLLLSTSDVNIDLSAGACERINLDLVAFDDLPDSNPDVAMRGRNLAYIIYTSGSTGQPKGTLIEHRSVLRLVLNTNYQDFGAQPNIAMLAPISFDASTYEMWGSLLNGGQCIIFPERKPDIDALGDLLATNPVDSLFLTTAFFNTIIDAAPEILRGIAHVLTGGEAISLPHIKKATRELPKTELVHVYGPTESTTFTCAFRIPAELPADWRTVPIGRPIANTTVYILSEWLHPVPVGVIGELHIGGDGLSRGYLNQPELTAERFIADPFSNESDARLYKTGDLVRFLADGDIEFVGRKDNQFKLRGFRIEGGEIEAWLTDHATVSNSAVILHESAADYKQLVAYVVKEVGAEFTEAALAEYLGEHLPKYMVPSLFIEVDEIPLTANGKLDHKALPAPDWSKKTSLDHVMPGTRTEEMLAEIWAQVLGVEHVGVQDNFFDLGGQSLLTIKLIRKIEAASGEQLSIADVFENPTIREFSKLLEGADWKVEALHEPRGLGQIWKGVANLFGRS